MRRVFVWLSENRRSGASDHQKNKNNPPPPQEKNGITRPRPDGGVILVGLDLVFIIESSCFPLPRYIRIFLSNREICCQKQNTMT